MIFVTEMNDGVETRVVLVLDLHDDVSAMIVRVISCRQIDWLVMKMTHSDNDFESEDFLSCDSHEHCHVRITLTSSA